MQTTKLTLSADKNLVRQAKKLTLDTNVLLDVLTVREPFYGDSAGVWSLAESGRIEGWISAISSAVHAGAGCILTRNPDHFPRAPLPILSPAEFLAAHPFKRCRAPWRTGYRGRHFGRVPGSRAKVVQ